MIMTSEDWKTVLLAAITMLGSVFGPAVIWMLNEQRRKTNEAAASATKAATMVTQMKADLEENTSLTAAGNSVLLQTKQVVDKVKTLVNGNMVNLKEDVAGLRDAMTKHNIACPPPTAT